MTHTKLYLYTVIFGLQCMSVLSFLSMASMLVTFNPFNRDSRFEVRQVLTFVWQSQKGVSLNGSLVQIFSVALCQNERLSLERIHKPNRKFVLEKK